MNYGFTRTFKGLELMRLNIASKFRNSLIVDKGAFKRKELWGKILLLEHVQQKRRQSRGALALSMQI